jgi:anti-sigma regulatory factor (Ser/Thr protein kinase)
MTTTTYPSAPLTQANQALESSRDAGFDLSAAVGEVADNSYEAGAQHVRIGVVKDRQGSITDMAFADDGQGIDPEVLSKVLSLGYSSRYGSRVSLGRFGMGLKLSSLSQARRVEVYSQLRGQSQIFRTILDLDEVRDGAQTILLVDEVDAWPCDFGHLMVRPDGDKKPFSSGTLVVWRKIDRLQHGGRFGASVDERVQDLKKFLARAYRRFIDGGLKIDVEGQEISLHDPLFMLENPRVTKRFGRSLKAREIDSDQFEVDGHTVKWMVTLLPEELRPKRGAGGRATKGREEFADLYIPDNESKVSILRNGREIYYDLIPKLYPGGKDVIDRFIGVEIDFPATLDEYFQVRNVKRGAEPVSKLREQLRKALKKPIDLARKDVRAHWDEVEQKERTETGDDHMPAHDAVDDFDKTAPGGRANPDATPAEVDDAIKEIVTDMGLDADDPAAVEKAKWVRESFEKRAVTIIDGHWPGKELMDIRHLSGKAILKMNHRHPFMAELAGPLKTMAETDPEELDVGEVSRLLKKLSMGLDLLFIAYAKAENMHSDPDEAYGELRSHWGLFSAGLVKEGLKRGG